MARTSHSCLGFVILNKSNLSPHEKLHLVEANDLYFFARGDRLFAHSVPDLTVVKHLRLPSIELKYGSDTTSPSLYARARGATNVPATSRRKARPLKL